MIPRLTSHGDLPAERLHRRFVPDHELLSADAAPGNSSTIASTTPMALIRAGDVQQVISVLAGLEAGAFA